MRIKRTYSRSEEVWAGAMALAMALCLSVASQARAQQQTRPAVERAALAQDWSALVESLSGEKTLSASEHVLMGHAKLALNRNNESVCHFFSAAHDAALKAWDTWTKAFAKVHADKAIASYFRGDAHARLDRWDEAIASFDRALGLQPGHALSMNAKGAALAGKGDWDAATILLDELIAKAPDFVDAYASRGTIYVKRSQAPRGAMRWFQRAIDRAPQFALALNGRGVAHFAVGDWERATEDFRLAGKLTGCAVIASNNLVAMQGQRLKALQADAQLLAQAAPGMTTHRTLETLRDANTQYMKTHAQDMKGMKSAYTKARWYGAGADMVNGLGAVKAIPLAGPLATSMSRFFEDRAQRHQARGDALRDKIQTDSKAMQQMTTDLVRQRIPNFRPGGADIPKNIVPPRDSGGVSADMSHAHVDGGHWPVSTWFGLGYEISPDAKVSSL